MSYHKSNEIAEDFIRGFNCSVGKFNLIEENVKVGENVTIKNYVELRKGTIFGNGCYIDSRVSTSGGDTCRMGDNVTLRYGAIIARNVIIEDDVFISPQVGFINIPFMKREQKTTIIKKGVLIGFNATIKEGITIAEGVIIGAKANVTKDILKAGVYVGNPARLLERNKCPIRMGKNVIIHKGANIGAEPFAFESIYDGGKTKEPKGGVWIGDRVWVGCNTTIMRGMKTDTHIGNDVKIAQMVNIGHDSIIASGVRICVGTEMGGYTKIGKNSYISMGVTIRNRAKIGEYTLIGQGSNVVSDIPDNVIAYGNPCKVISKRFKPIEYYVRRFIS